MRDEILKLADKLEAGERNDYLTSLEIRRIVAAEDAHTRVAQTDARPCYNDDGSIEVRACPRCNGDGVIHRPTAEARCACEGDNDN